MGLAARKRSIIDQRLKELEKQSRFVDDDIRLLSRALKRSDQDIAWKRLKTVGQPPEVVREPGRAPEPEAEAEPGEELFHWRRRQRPAAGPPAAAPQPTTPSLQSAAEKKRFEVDQQFANYFASGSFAPSGSAEEDRSVQRNKAIFMVVVVLVVTFIVLKLLIL
ncbi:MAG: hypothetical protein JXB04_12385 [Kiritimatiellae bacterium]|nr:hypothetical protein [Kiritimatiellia bacterium]